MATHRAEASRRHLTPAGPLVEAGPEELLSDHATAFTWTHLRVHPGERAAEAGCGTGMLSIFAARSGAFPVIGTDLDPTALQTARDNARRNGVAGRVAFCRGSLLEPVRGPLDLVVALLPQKPAPRPFNPRFYGGRDGADLLCSLIRQAADRLVRGGRLILYHHSLANPPRVDETLASSFHSVVLSEKKRHFTWTEFEALTPGMTGHLQAQRTRGEAEFDTDEAGPFFWGRVLEAIRR